MDLIYQAVSNLDVLWLISAALVILILDVFILGTTALLLVSATLFVLSVIKYFIDDPVIVTWSIPTVLVALFLMQRFFINISVSQKLPNQEKRQGTFKAVVRLPKIREAAQIISMVTKTKNKLLQTTQSTKIDGLKHS